MPKKKKNRYHKVRALPVHGDRVARPHQLDQVGVVFGSVPRGRGHSVLVDWGDRLFLFEPMSELVSMDEVAT